MKNPLIKQAFNEYGFLIARNEELTFMSWADRIQRAYGVERVEIKQVYDALLMAEGSIKRTIFGNLQLRMP